jgi:hypothetical protein
MFTFRHLRACFYPSYIACSIQTAVARGGAQFLTHLAVFLAVVVEILASSINETRAAYVGMEPWF